MNLRPQDVVVALEVALRPGQVWTFPALAKQLRLSTSEVHAAVRRLLQAGLAFRPDPDVPWPRINAANLLEFVVHGVRYAFAAERRGLTRGVPTGIAAPVLEPWFGPPAENPPVWPHRDGPVWGEGLAPLYRKAVEAALADERLYAGLALIDALRTGRARERAIAADALERLLATEVPG